MFPIETVMLFEKRTYKKLSLKKHGRDTCGYNARFQKSKGRLRETKFSSPVYMESKPNTETANALLGSLKNGCLTGFEAFLRMIARYPVHFKTQYKKTFKMLWRHAKLSQFRHLMSRWKSSAEGRMDQYKDGTSIRYYGVVNGYSAVSTWRMSEQIHAKRTNRMEISPVRNCKYVLWLRWGAQINCGSKKCKWWQ